MKVLLISNSIIEYDGRLRELVKIAKGIGDTYYISRALSLEENEKSHYVFSSLGKFNYIRFIKYCLHIAKNIDQKTPIDILFVDNRKAILPAILIKNKIKIKYIIYDSRELYLLKESRSISNFIGCVLENLFIHNFNVIICANSQRSKIMKDIYNLKKNPLVFENLRKLNFSNRIENMQNYEKKYKKIFNNNTFIVTVTDGFSQKRGTDKLIEAIKNLGKKYSLVIAGKTTAQDMNKLKKMLELNEDNIHVVGILAEQELNYIINKSNVGFASYPMDTYNNIYCASGKIYEFIFEGLPIITSKNPPLVEICNKYKIGIATENYITAIMEISNNYQYYKNNVLNMQKIVSVENNNNKLIDQIKKELHI